jgi:hypothetical protein
VRSRTSLGLVLAAAAGAALLAACLPTTTTCEDLRSCAAAGGKNQAGTSGRGGSSGTAGALNGGNPGNAGSSASGGSAHAGSPNGGDAGSAGDSGTLCDTTKSPSQESCLIDNEYAVFVAPTGKDGASGTKAAPVKTIAKAVELAGDTKMVIACDGTYDEQVKLTAGAKLYGGFACPGSAAPWSYESGKKAKVAPSTRGLALGIATDAAAVIIEDFEFDAKDGVDPGESSVAAFVSTSTNVALTRVKLVAGRGVDGANGALAQLTLPDPSTLKGTAANGDSGGMFNTGMCSAGEKPKGGAGGNGGAGAATTGGSGTPDLGMGKGGIAGSCLAVGAGQDGANAAPQPPAPGASKLGTITAIGWNGSAGSDGATGTPGQGGGGGAGALAGGGGGGGGSGGCGGAGATGGKAGGSSIALLVLNSSIALTANELASGDAGNGGSGAVGQEGQAGGSGGVQVPDGCQGGKGGKGGQGGAGGGAAGGMSVGIAYQGATPIADSETVIATSAAGAKGIGGVPNLNDGIAGVKQDLFEVP